MVMVKLQSNEAFETAFFVLRDGFEGCTHIDIVGEANILAQGAFSSKSQMDKKRRRYTSRRMLFSFLSGLALGACVASALLLIF